MKLCILKYRYPRRTSFCKRALNIDKYYETISTVKDFREVCLKCVDAQQTELTKVRELKSTQVRGRPANDY